MKNLVFAVLLSIVFIGCQRVEPNNEGVLVSNYGRNGKEDFTQVVGSQNTMAPGVELYQVPMWEQKSDAPEVGITARDGGYFTVDPVYTYEAIRGKGVDIIFNYKHVGVTDKETAMDNIEANILTPLVLNAYRETARNYTTDSLLNHVNGFENQVEKLLRTQFEEKFFSIASLTSGLKPPASMIKAIENRNNAVQQAEQAKNELAIARINQERAKIDAETNRIRSAGLSEKNLQEKYIEAIRNSSNRIIITDGKTPIFIGQ